jgi:hypothetical protein
MDAGLRIFTLMIILSLEALGVKIRKACAMIVILPS